jgi:hypothetical protein
VVALAVAIEQEGVEEVMVAAEGMVIVEVAVDMKTLT